MMKVVYDSPRETCRAVLELYKSPREKKRLFAIQYNRFLSQSTTWWLSPVGVNPAYKYGKIGFIPCEDGQIRIGLYVEKGLGRESQMPSTQIMGSTWLWHTFLNEMETERFSTALNSIQSEAGTQPEIYIESFVGSAKDFIHFQWNAATEKLRPTGSEFRGASIENTANVSDLRSLAACLRGITPQPFVWIDFIGGIRFGLNGEAMDSWNAWTIEKNLLRHLEPWIR